MTCHDVLITGVGMVSSLGKTAPENLAGLKARRTGLRPVPVDGLDPALTIVGAAGEVNPFDGLPTRVLAGAKFVNRGSTLGFAAAREAVETSGIDVSEIVPERKSAFVGCGDMDKIDYKSFYPAMRQAVDESWQRVDAAKLNRATLTSVNPTFLLGSIYNNIFSFLTAVFEMRGPGTSIAAQSPAGAQALGLGYRAVREGRADVALVVGSCHWTPPVATYEMQALDLLSRGRLGAASYRPMDRQRDGFLPGEGGAAVLLESREHAEQRPSAQVLGRVVGCAVTQEAGTDAGFGFPCEAATRAARLAMAEAGLSPRDLAFVSPHGSGTRKGDHAEMVALLDVLGEAAPDVPICCLKPYTGHMAAASDVGDLVLGLLALREGRVPATLNFERADEGCQALSLCAEHRATIRTALLSLSHGIGGPVVAVAATTE